MHHHRPFFRMGDASDGALAHDLHVASRRRIHALGLIFAATFVAAYVMPQLLGVWGEDEFDRTLPNTVAGISIVASLLLALAARWGRVSTPRLYALALLFQPVGALGIATTEWWGFWAGVESGGPLYIYGISWVCVWIVMFPSLVPARPWPAFFSSLAAGAVSPLMLFVLMAQFGADTTDLPLGLLTFAATLPVAISIGMAAATATVLRGLHARVEEARRLGAYRLVERLGEGGMGEVWRAEHDLLARPAAIKLIRHGALASASAATSSSTVVKRFEREAQATAQLSCPHTVNLFDFGISPDGRFYYVMELLDGLDLETLVERDGPQPAGRVVSILQQVCASLDEAHRAGLIHRDIKPANIFLCRYGLDVDFAKVLDFGLVKGDPARRSDETRLTAANTLPGTPAYMAPEAILAEAEIGPSADIYALGCVAYWMLTGRLVFESDSPMRLAMMHVDREPVAPSAVSELPIPAALEALVIACLAKAPNDRPASVRAIREALTRLAADVAPWTTEQAEAWWQTHRPQRLAEPTESA